MSTLKNPVDILKLLPKTNCRKCKAPTCLAFAAMVTKSQKRLEDCPYLDTETLAGFDLDIEHHKSWDREMGSALDSLKEKVAGLDFGLAAERTDGALTGAGLTINCLGKPFTVDRSGNISSQCHTNIWLTVPFLRYVIYCSGRELTGEWAPLRELKNGLSWAPLFGQRCEKVIKKLADEHTEFFEDMIDIFNGRMSEREFDSDISMVLHPMPRLPMLICYWKPEEEMESILNVFFDTTAEDNAGMEALYYLGAGMARMFENITRTHT